MKYWVLVHVQNSGVGADDEDTRTSHMALIEIESHTEGAGVRAPRALPCLSADIIILHGKQSARRTFCCPSIQMVVE